MARSGDDRTLQRLRQNRCRRLTRIVGGAFSAPIPPVALVPALAALLLALGAPLTLHGQTGTVAGTVVSGRSLAGLSDVFVSAGQGQSAVTNAEGRFVLEGLSGTEVTLQFELIGYRTQSLTTQVGAADLRVVMGESAIALNEQRDRGHRAVDRVGAPLDRQCRGDDQRGRSAAPHALTGSQHNAQRAGARSGVPG